MKDDKMLKIISALSDEKKCELILEKTKEAKKLRTALIEISHLVDFEYDNPDSLWVKCLKYGDGPCIDCHSPCKYEEEAEQAGGY